MHSTEYAGHHHVGASGLGYASRERTSISARTKWFHAEYMGFTAMDRRFSSPMLPWVIAEICRRGMNDKVWLSVQDGYVRVVDEENMKTIFRHPLVGITRIAFAPDPRRTSLPSHSASAPSTPTTPLHSTPTLTTSPSFSPGLGAHLDSGGRRCFFYLVRDPTENLLSCYLYRAPDSATVVELFTSMREQSTREANGHGPQARSFSSAAALTSLCADISPSSSHFFEVLYIGKIKVSHRKVPETFIDEALERFRVHEKEKAQRRARLGFSTSSHAILGTASSHGSPPKNIPAQASISPTNPSQTHSTSPPPTIVEDVPKSTPIVIQPESRPGNGASSQSNFQQAEVSEKSSVYKYQDPEFSCAGKLSTETLHMVASSMNEARMCAVSGASSKAEESTSAPKGLVSDGDGAGKSSLTTELQEAVVSNQASGNNILLVKKPHAMLNEVSRMSSQDSGCTSPLEMGSNENLSTIKEQQSSHLTSQLQNKLQETIGAKGAGAISIVKDQKLHSPELPTRNRTCSGDASISRPHQVPMEPMRVRAGSIGSSSSPNRVDNHSAEFKQSETSTNTEHNRTMLFQVGRSDLRLISPDRKQILMHKYLRDVVNCIQGAKNPEYFGFICKEPNVECFVGYVFRCQSGSVADDVAGAITQAFSATNDPHRKDKHKAQVQQPPPVVSCEHCPMVWYHKLCAEIEGLNDRRTQATIFRRLEQLPDDEQESVMIKFRGAETVSGKSGSPGRDGSTNNGSSVREQNEFLMMLLRAHCEAKQPRHVHDTAENRSEFLNHYLGGSTIFMKAKRSLTSSFDHLLKRRGSRDDFLAPPVSKELSLPISATLCKDGIANIATVTANSRSASGESLKESPTNTPVRDLAPSVVTTPATDPSTNAVNLPSPIKPERFRPRSSTVGTSGGETMKREVLARQTSTSKPIAIPLNSQQQQNNTNGHQKSPMMNIFFKVGNQPKNVSGTSPDEKSPNTRNKQHGSWRQAIYNRVVTPGKSITLTGSGPGEIGNRTPLVKKEKAELRALWRKAIMQQILLIRMDKENARLTARQEEATVKRIKLDYDEISPCLKQVNEVWELLVSKESRISAKCDSQMLLQAIRQGVPRSKRGEVWQFLAEQHNLRTHPVDLHLFPNYNVTYRGLLKQLTSHQHGILVDLGRTFPNHPYFSSPLGPGQLELFNLLKAYSLLDPEVGYCQGLSFVAGVLLLHMSEESAFLLLRHLLFRRDLRRQYLPDMAALQVQLYQLSRLLHDTYPDLYEHFDQNEVAPTLYAAPWILTIFASQFPLGFVTRVFDLLFLEGPDIVFRFALALLGEWKTELLACTNFEEIMECLKTTVPNMDKHMLDNVMKQVFSMDVNKLLHEYEVEYHVLQEEMASSLPESDSSGRNLRQQNSELLEQLKDAQDSIEHLEALSSSQKAAISCLESQVRSLENTLGTMARYIASLHDKVTPATNQQSSNRFTNNLPQIPEMPQDIWKYVTAFSKSGLSPQNPASIPTPMSPPNSVSSPTTIIPSNLHTMSNGAPPGWLPPTRNKAISPLASPFATVSPPILKTSLSTSDLYSVRTRNGTTPLSVSPLVLPPASIKKIESLTCKTNIADVDKPAETSPTGVQMHPLDSIAGDVSFTFGTSSLRSLKPGRGGANNTGSTRSVQNSSEDNFVLRPAERSLSDGMSSVPRGENGLIKSGR